MIVKTPGTYTGRGAYRRDSNSKEMIHLARIISNQFLPDGEICFLVNVGSDRWPAIGIRLATGAAGIRLNNSIPEKKWDEEFSRFGIWADGYGAVYAVAELKGGRAARCAAELLGKIMVRQWNTSVAGIEALLNECGDCGRSMKIPMIRLELERAVDRLKSSLPIARERIADLQRSCDILDVTV